MTKEMVYCKDCKPLGEGVLFGTPLCTSNPEIHYDALGVHKLGTKPDCKNTLNDCTEFSPKLSFKIKRFFRRLFK